MDPTSPQSPTAFPIDSDVTPKVLPTLSTTGGSGARVMPVGANDFYDLFGVDSILCQVYELCVLRFCMKLNNYASLS
jgi:hypothetical protein